MAYKKNKKKYSSEEKFNYHNSRYFSAAKYGCKFGDPKHLYSAGFRDGFKSIDNTRAVTGEFGKKGGNAYSIGNKRGAKSAREYFNRTKKNPASLR